MAGWLHRRGREWIREDGPDLSSDELAKAKWPLARPPYLLETSRPGIFAVGDVRRGNVKRVASAVGEGSIAVTFVHQALREFGTDPNRAHVRSPSIAEKHEG